MGQLFASAVSFEIVVMVREPGETDTTGGCVTNGANER